MIDPARVLAVYRRNLLVWRKLAPASLVGNVAEPLITLLAFGYGLGGLLGEVDGVRYIVFLTAGAICMSTTMAASFEALYSAFSRMQAQRTWESLMNAPVELDDILVAEWLWAASKATLSGTAIVAVAVGLGVTRAPSLVWVFPVIVLTGLCFAAIGLVFNALARGYDFFTFYFTLGLTPMVFISGVYYPTSSLPGWLETLAAALPLSAAVRLARPLVIGEWPAAPMAAIVLMVAWTVAALTLARYLTRKRFRQ